MAEPGNFEQDGKSSYGRQGDGEVSEISIVTVHRHYMIKDIYEKVRVNTISNLPRSKV